jgi:hypothetical protein
MTTFDYVLERISAEPLRTTPFKHLYLEDVFSGADFAQIISASEVDIKSVRDDDQLFDGLHAAGYEIIKFPGCVADQAQYVSWHAHRGGNGHIHSTCEGFGVALRLKRPKSRIIAELSAFLASEAFVACLADKFDLPLTNTRFAGGLQKYLDGYEISPHPDIRAKALTFMVNINPHPNAGSHAHHTHYMSFRDERRYVQDYWRANPGIERCWVPWDWCETKFVQANNNSMVAFAPSDDTIHAIKATYDHFEGQRTQLYGNIFRRNAPKLSKLEWQDLRQLQSGEVSSAND